MSMRPLSRPVTIEHEYLAAILAELRAIRQKLDGPQLPANVVELKEPAKRKRKE